MPEITVYPSNETIPPHIDCQIRSFIRVTWFDGYQYDLNAPLMAPEWHPVHVVLAEQHVVYAYAAAVWQFMEHQGEQYKMYGLSSVFTYPAFRRKGYGAQVVGTATAEIERHGDADFAVLFTDPHLEGFYARSGWQHTPDSTVQIGSRQQPQVYAAFTMMRFLSQRAKRVRQQFESQPFYFADFAW